MNNLAKMLLGKDSMQYYKHFYISTYECSEIRYCGLWKIIPVSVESVLRFITVR